MKRGLLFILLLNFIGFKLIPQSIKNMSSSEILLDIKKLNTVGSVLYIAAHPDDENTRLLGFLANEKKLRTGYLSLTRGDGGQNLIGKEQGEALGLIRTQELLAARRTDGAEQFFTRAQDFGYSKNPHETFTFWNKDSILYDVVLTIRRFKPDVIVCRFPTTGEGGHGHHTASAILALQAFDDAANPRVFPDQLKFTQIWQAKRIFWNTFNFGGTNTTSPDQLKVDVGVFNSLIGKSYGEIAAESRSMHKSQGFGSAKQRGSSIEYFKLLKGDSSKSDLFEGINLNWNRFSRTEKLQKNINDCITHFEAEHPEKSIKDLVSIYKQLMLLDEKDKDLIYWKTLKLKETEGLLIKCSGLWLEVIAGDFAGVPNKDINVVTQFVNRTNEGGVKLNSITYLNQIDTNFNLVLKQNEFYTFKRKLKLNEGFSFSNPYWLNEKHDLGFYTVKDQSLIGKPENESQAKVVFNISFLDLTLDIEKNLVYKTTDPVKGEVYRPFEIFPPATVNLSERVFVFNNSGSKTVQFTIKSNISDVKGVLKLKISDGWQVDIKNAEFNLKSKGEEVILDATISCCKNGKVGKLEASLEIENAEYNQSIQRIEYDHIPYQFILSPAQASLINIDLKKASNKIAYILGAGDEVVSCLKQIGYDVTILTDELLKQGDLSKYSAIVTGIRAYNTNERLQLYHDQLMMYIKNGGNLIVQYNTNSRVGPLQAKIGPYPFTISRDRVTNEKAEVRFINETHSALNFPNKITQNDFSDWIQERGIYYATDIDRNYETLFSMNDAGEKPSEGSLIISKYGKGNFVYTGLVFFRELPAGVPGAYRLFANLLSLPNNK